MSSTESLLSTLVSKATGPKRSRIRILGVGSAGSHFVEHMRQLGLEGVDYAVVDTDPEALEKSSATDRILITPEVRVGVGVEEHAREGAIAALRAEPEITRAVRDADIVFLTTGLGGGTGAGATPVIGEIAREQGALVLPVVMEPFGFEDQERLLVADRGREELISRVESPIIVSSSVPSLGVSHEATYQNASYALSHGVRDILRMIKSLSSLNVEIPDTRSVLKPGEVTLLGVGHDPGGDRAGVAVARALQRFPQSAVQEAGEILVHTAAKDELPSQLVDRIVNAVAGAAPNTRIISRVTIDPLLDVPLQVTLFVAGLPGKGIPPKRPPKLPEHPSNPPAEKQTNTGEIIL